MYSAITLNHLSGTLLIPLKKKKKTAGFKLKKLSTNVFILSSQFFFVIQIIL